MVEDARMLYDAEVPGRMPGSPSRALGELGARRVWRGNAWYWDLKPDLRPGEVSTL